MCVQRDWNCVNQINIKLLNSIKMENSRLQNERWKIQDFKMKFMRRDLFKLKTTKKKIEWFNDNKTNVYSVSCLKELLRNRKSCTILMHIFSIIAYIVKLLDSLYLSNLIDDPHNRGVYLWNRGNMFKSGCVVYLWNRGHMFKSGCVPEVNAQLRGFGNTSKSAKICVNVFLSEKEKGKHYMQQGSSNITQKFQLCHLFHNLTQRKR